ncbi:hypothetical protein L6164_014488 [Bauhinia variegata]|uniref:Uncharacterized protein n=1 Tax=Bauhinia variegata TaxID=167791 RepID=A0ACB9NHN3_BAUVA|nr:hypothetical protein L6164_014488 [Bauhinia variegata]
MRWEKVQVNPLQGQGVAQQGVVELSGPGKRWGHSCNAIKGGRLLYVFGGYGKDNCQTNQVHVFDTGGSTSKFHKLFCFIYFSHSLSMEFVTQWFRIVACLVLSDEIWRFLIIYWVLDFIALLYSRLCSFPPPFVLLVMNLMAVMQTWILPVIKGTPPTPRDSHSCTTIGDNLFVFGGTDGVNPLKDLHILDTSMHTWISPGVRGEGPEAREGHSAALVGKRLFIFGGCGKSADNNNEVYYNDLYILNTETFVWKCVVTSGTPPSPRDSHTCSSWKNKVIVIGGEDRHDYYLSDVHILDTDTLIWRELNTSGQLLPPRAGHSTVSFGRNLFVFGGFTDAQNLYNDLYMLDVDTGIWTRVATAGVGPSARFSVAGDCLDPVKGGVLVFIGGCNKNLEALDDMFYLYTGLARETEQRPEKLSLRKQLKLKCQEQNVNTVQNQGLFRYGVGADVSQPMTMLGYSQPSLQNIPLKQSMPSGKVPFQAKVTGSMSEGYRIETVIDGKPLHGILFPNKPNFNFPHPTTATSSGKRAATETGSVISGGMDPNKLKKSKALKQDEIEDRQIDVIQRDSSASNENRTEAVATLIPGNPTVDTSEPLKVSVNKLPEAVSLNPNDDKKNDIPRSLGEGSRNDGANDAPSSIIDLTTVDKANEMPRSETNIPIGDKSINVASSITDDVPSSSADVPTDDKANDASISKTDDRTNDVPSSSADVRTDDKTNDAPISNTGEPSDDRTNDVPSSNTDVPTDDKTNDAPISETGGPTSDRTNVAPVSSSEVPRHDQASDEPICSTEVLKPAAAESVLSLSNQDCTGASIEEKNEPSKSS